FLAELTLEQEGSQQAYFLPLALLWSEAIGGMPAQYAMARVRRGSELGLATDGYSVPEFIQALLENFRAETKLPVRTTAGKASIQFRAEPRLHDVPWPHDPEILWFHGEQSNSSLMIGDDAALKLVRHVVAGIHPGAEMSRHLGRAGYGNIAALLGELLRVDADGTPHTLALLHCRINNQGDAWSWTQEYLKRMLENAAFTDVSDESRAEHEEELHGYRSMAATIGRRLAQMHAVLAQPSEQEAFEPIQARRRDAQAWARSVRAMLERAIKAATGMRAQLPESAQSQLHELERAKKSLSGQIDKAAQALTDNVLTRIHGDLHLGQVLIALGDADCVYFNWRPVRPLEERRTKTSAWRDVAGMIRSFDYASAAFAMAEASALVSPATSTGEAQEPRASGQ